MCANNFDVMAEGLVEETLVETATTFFGARKALEDEIEMYRNRNAELRKIEEGVLGRAAALHSLFSSRDAIEGFYDALGVVPGQLADASEVAAPHRDGLGIPRALTPSGRYAKLVFAAYAVLAQELDAYVHGKHRKDESGRKVLTVNYTQMLSWCESLNKSIEALNRDHSPSGTMCFIKGLDPCMIEKDRLSGATIDGYADELDKELAFKPVECMAVHYLAAPELPVPEDARAKVLAYAKGAYAKDPAAAKTTLALWKQETSNDGGS